MAETWRRVSETWRQGEPLVDKLSLPPRRRVAVCRLLGAPIVANNATTNATAVAEHIRLNRSFVISTPERSWNQFLGPLRCRLDVAARRSADGLNHVRRRGAGHLLL